MEKGFQLSRQIQLSKQMVEASHCVEWHGLCHLAASVAKVRGGKNQDGMEEFLSHLASRN